MGISLYQQQVAVNVVSVCHLICAFSDVCEYDVVYVTNPLPCPCHLSYGCLIIDVM